MISCVQVANNIASSATWTREFMCYNGYVHLFSYGIGNFITNYTVIEKVVYNNYLH